MTFFRCLCLLFILCCCNSKPKTDAGMIRVSVLRGPSAIAFAHWMKETPVIDGKPLSVRIIDSPDLMQATLIKGEADIAVLPMISAVNLYNKGIRYHLAGCPIWWDLCPRPVNTFLEKYDFAGKTVIPFATSGGSSITGSVKQLKRLYPKIEWEEGRLCNRSTKQVGDWAKQAIE